MTTAPLVVIATTVEYARTFCEEEGVDWRDANVHIVTPTDDRKLRGLDYFDLWCVGGPDTNWRDYIMLVDEAHERLERFQNES